MVTPFKGQEVVSTKGKFAGVMEEIRWLFLLGGWGSRSDGTCKVKCAELELTSIVWLGFPLEQSVWTQTWRSREEMSTEVGTGWGLVSPEVKGPGQPSLEVWEVF